MYVRRLAWSVTGWAAVVGQWGSPPLLVREGAVGLGIFDLFARAIVIVQHVYVVRLPPLFTREKKKKRKKLSGNEVIWGTTCIVGLFVCVWVCRSRLACCDGFFSSSSFILLDELYPWALIMCSARIYMKINKRHCSPQTSTNGTLALAVFHRC